MADDFFCWNCGAALQDLLFPISRRDECAECRAELHVCRFCQFYDPLRAGACSEEQAEEVRDKERANFCDYFKPQANIQLQKEQAKTGQARDQLADLFGESNTENDAPAYIKKSGETAREALDALFHTDDGKNNNKDS